MQEPREQPLGAGERLRVWKRLTAEVRPESGLPKAARRHELGILLSWAWSDYGGSGILDAPIDIIDQLYMCAFNFIKLAGELEAIPPIHAITIGDISKETEATFRLLKDVVDLDTIIMRVYASDGTERYDKVRPREILQGILVKRARDLGMSWKRIGEAVGMSAQGIQQKAQDRGWTSDNGLAEND